MHTTGSASLTPKQSSISSAMSVFVGDVCSNKRKIFHDVSLQFTVLRPKILHWAHKNPHANDHEGYCLDPRIWLCWSVCLHFMQVSATSFFLMVEADSLVCANYCKQTCFLYIHKYGSHEGATDQICTYCISEHLSMGQSARLDCRVGFCQDYCRMWH